MWLLELSYCILGPRKNFKNHPVSFISWKSTGLVKQWENPDPISYWKYQLVLQLVFYKIFSYLEIFRDFLWPGNKKLTDSSKEMYKQMNKHVRACYNLHVCQWHMCFIELAFWVALGSESVFWWINEHVPICFKTITQILSSGRIALSS